VVASAQSPHSDQKKSKSVSKSITPARNLDANKEIKEVDSPLKDYEKIRTLLDENWDPIKDSP